MEPWMEEITREKEEDKNMIAFYNEYYELANNGRSKKLDYDQFVWWILQPKLYLAKKAEILDNSYAILNHLKGYEQLEDLELLDYQNHQEIGFIKVTDEEKETWLSEMENIVMNELKTDNATSTAVKREILFWIYIQMTIDLEKCNNYEERVSKKKQKFQRQAAKSLTKRFSK